jgi:hypothetical protein
MEYNMSNESKPAVSEPEKLVSSVLYTEGTAEIKKKVTEELKVPDPAPDTAEAALIEFEQSASH